MKYFLTLLLCLLSQASFATIALDGTPQTTNSTAQTLVLPAFTTTGTTDTVIVDEVDLNATSNSTVSGIAGAGSCSGLVFTYRTSFRWGAAGLFDVEEWYAKNVGALTSCVVTVTLNSNANYQDRAWIFAYSGTDPNNPFDVNASLPGTNNATDTTKNIAPSSAISTTNANTVLLGFMCASGGYTSITYPSNFSNILTGGTTCNPSGNIVSSTQSSISPQWQWTGSSTARALIVDALQAAPSGSQKNYPFWFGK